MQLIPSKHNQSGLVWFLSGKWGWGADGFLQRVQPGSQSVKPIYYNKNLCCACSKFIKIFYKAIEVFFAMHCYLKLRDDFP